MSTVITGRSPSGRPYATMSYIFDIVFYLYYTELYKTSLGFDMAWREQVAWLSLTVTAVAYSLYFGLVARSERSMLGMLLLFGTVVIAQAIVMIVGSTVLAIRAGGDARGKPDERDRAIDRRGAQIAYFVLLVGMILVGVVMPFSERGWQISNAALLALVSAEVVRYAVVVLSYRRGWHG